MLKILIVDDHDLIIDSILHSVMETFENLDIKRAHSIDEVITTYKLGYFDVIILDIGLPSTIEEYKSGHELGISIRKYYPECKIIILTSTIEKIKIYNIYHSVRPHGFFIKSDVNSNQLKVDLYKIIRDDLMIRSNTVDRALEEFKRNSYFLDTYNRQILILLSQGIKTKNLPDHLPLSLSAIDKRKAYIKLLLNVTGGDEEILAAARNYKLIT